MAAKTHIIRGDRSACGLSGRRLRSLTPSAVLPAPIPFVLLKGERQTEILMATTCKSCINRRWDL